MQNRLLSICVTMAIPLGAFSQTFNYAPNMVNIPCLTQKGDATLGIGWGRGAEFQALELQAVYSPLPHFAVMANYFGARDKDVRKNLLNGTDFYLWETALGIYEKAPKGSASLFAGFGSGNLYSHYGADRTAAFDLKRVFIQPGLNYRSAYFQAGLGLRLNYLFYQKGIVSFAIDEPDIRYIQNLEKASPVFLPELGINVGMRIKPITISLNIASVFQNATNWGFNSLNTALSIALDLGVRRKKSET